MRTNEMHGPCGASYSGVRFGAILLVAACGSSNSDPARTIENKPPPPAEQKPPTAVGQVPPAAAGNADPSAPPPLAKLRIDWSNIVTQSDCFYFSGPEGRDDHLEGDVTVDRNGSDVRLRIGDEIFTGTFRDNELAVQRQSSHDFGGPWNVTEIIRGRYREGLMRARYHYEECELGQACPGRCTIDAKLSFVR